MRVSWLASLTMREMQAAGVRAWFIAGVRLELRRVFVDTCVPSLSDGIAIPSIFRDLTVSSSTKSIPFLTPKGL